MSLGKDSSLDTGSTTQSIWGGQSGFLTDLFGGASNQLNDTVNQNNQVNNQAVGTFNNLTGGGVNPFLKQQGQAGLDVLNQNFDRNLSTIKGNSAISGGLGGSRQGVAESLALQENQTQASNFITNLYGGNYQADQNRAASVLPYANQLGTSSLQPFAQLAQILGGPTTLTNSRNNSTSSGFEFGL